MPVAALALVPGATGLALAIALLLNGPLAWRLGVGRGDAAGQLAGRTAETSGGTSGAIDRPA
jgi:hypothetical protein